ncbi:MAG: FtsX-like permease family protein [Flavobacteriales bacterium]|nr:FtsX-like permease family protein [Flavobacteriales bacterium]
MYQTNASEKFFSFLVLTFIGLIGAFNIIASLTMMMIEKQKDMRTLRSLGAAPEVIRRVFLYEGLLIVLVGVMAGLALGLGVCWAQERFGAGSALLVCCGVLPGQGARHGPCAGVRNGHGHRPVGHLGAVAGAQQTLPSSRHQRRIGGDHFVQDLL